MDNRPTSGDTLADARKEFRGYYSIATTPDAVLMDELINMFTLLTLAINHPRDPGNPMRHELEKVTDATDQGFAAAREAVRSCQTFHNLCAGDQRRIENVLFEVYPPWER
jgi:hypothetical protein